MFHCGKNQVDSFSGCIEIWLYIQDGYKTPFYLLSPIQNKFEIQVSPVYVHGVIIAEYMCFQLIDFKLRQLCNCSSNLQSETTDMTTWNCVASPHVNKHIQHNLIDKFIYYF